MKNIVMIMILLSALFNAVSARDFDIRIENQCKEYVSDEGRYHAEASGYILGVVSGMQFMIPADKRSAVFNKTRGYIADRACMIALKNSEDIKFALKYQKAVYHVLSK